MECLRTLREKRKKTQVWLAEKCECHPTTISQIENGRMKPSLKRFEKMAAALRVSLKRLNAAIQESQRLSTISPAPVTNLQEERERRASRN